MSDNMKVNSNLTPNKKVVVKVNKTVATNGSVSSRTNGNVLAGRTTQSGVKTYAVNKTSTQVKTIPASRNPQTATKKTITQNKPDMAELARKADEEAKRNYLKTKRKRFFRASLVCIMGAAMLLGGGLYSHSQRKDYASWSQVEEISNALNCDMSYMEMVGKRAIKTFQHNKGEPIYVSLPDDAPEHIKESIKLSLDYMFGIMEQINSNYKYKIVSDAELNAYKMKGKSTIEFNRSEKALPTTMSADAMISADRDLTSFVTFGKMVDNYTITYDAQKLEKQTPSIESGCEVFLHELLHVFSFSDVYDRDAVYANSYIHPSVGDKYDVFLPNDLKCLISAYAPKLKNNAEKREYISNMKKLVSDYEKTFYRDVIAEEKRNTTVDIENGNISLILKNSIKQNKQTYNYYYKIEISNGRYNLNIFDENKNLLDSNQGEVIWVDGVYVLKDACLKHGLGSNLHRALQGNSVAYENLITDLRLYKYTKTIYDEEYSCLLATNFSLPEHCTVEASKGFETKVTSENNLEDAQIEK